MQSYAIAVDEVERKTGFDFFHELPDEIETKLEGEVIVKDWNWGNTYSSKNSGISKSKLKINNKSLERLPEGSSIQCFGKTKKGLRCRKKTLNADGYCQHHKSKE